MNTMVADALLGRTVDGRYRVDSRLAAGGMATVYRATDLRLDRPVALKVMRTAMAQDPDFVSRFQTEARAAARLSDPHVVAVFDQGTSDGLVYLAMEYVPGRTVRDILHDHGPLAPEQALAVLDQTLQALAAAHDAGFMHRDVKPENLLVADNGMIKVTDFGLARALQSPSSLTQGVLIGTAAYLAPEQVSHGESDERSDVYQAGVLLFELLTGSAPHSGESQWAVALRHVDTDVPRLRAVRPDIPPDLDRLVADATARDRNRRIGSAREFLDRVRRIAMTLPPPQPFPARAPVVVPDTTTARLDRPEDPRSDGSSGEPPTPAASPLAAERRSWRVGALVVVALVVVAALAGWFTANGNPFDRTDVPTVVGATEAKAMAALSGAGFQPEVTERRFSEKVPAGIVLESDPEQQSSAQTGSTVALIVSLGPERYDVPKVKGQTPEKAAATLAATNLRADGQREAFHDTVEEGLVVGTDPKRGTAVKRDAAITMVVSKGPAPVKVPNLNGQTESAARSQLAELGLKIESVAEEESASVPKGSVIGTSPKQGTTLHRGDSLELIVSTGPPPVEMPNVVDQPRAEAIAQLEALGLKVRIDEGIVTPLNRVYSQDPPPGTDVPVGDTVTLSVF